MTLRRVEIHHPTSLSHERPEKPKNVEMKNTTSMVRFQKIQNGRYGYTDGKIRVIFKKNVEESNFTYKLNTTKNGSFKLGGEVTVTAEEEASAKETIAAKLHSGKTKYRMNTVAT